MVDGWYQTPELSGMLSGITLFTDCMKCNKSKPLKNVD